MVMNEPAEADSAPKHTPGRPGRETCLETEGRESFGGSEIHSLMSEVF